MTASKSVSSRKANSATGYPCHTKIVATIGPACEGPDRLLALIRAGVDVFRINTAHGSREDFQRRVNDVREAARRNGTPVAILVDLTGPKMRLGELAGGQLDCVLGSTVRFVREGGVKSPTDVTTTYPPLIDELSAGDRVMLADGTVALEVERKEADAAVCKVVQAGVVRSRQGVNLPGVKLSVPAMNDRDVSNARWAASAGVDFLSLSFVRTATDVKQLRAILKETGAATQIIAKIEKPEAVDNIEAIVAAADGVMVARGDLGVEIDIAQVPVVQKRIIAACHRSRRPVIVATQMLESMHHSRIPTRAEANDVANAILDGTDACMLSGETAVGEYPEAAVEMMHRIAVATETLLGERVCAAAAFQSDLVDPITEASAAAAVQLAEQLGVKMILAATASGRTALALSKHRRSVYTVGVSGSEATLRRMCLYWGVIPLPGAPTSDSEALLRFAIRRGRERGYLDRGDRVVMVAGTGVGGTQHNALVVHQVEDEASD
jgi:pyruvate kinase